MTPRVIPLLGLAATVAILAGCAPGAKTPPRTGPAEVVFGVYRGRIVSADGAGHSFRAWLWAEPPDRLHAEISPPLGGPSWILDAGAGRLAITDVRAATCWTGVEGPRMLEDWLGVPLDTAGLVGAILGRPGPPSPARTRREPEGAEGLPALLELRGDALGTLRLERTGYRVAPRGALGTAAPPPGVALRDLADLEAAAFDADGGGEGRP